MSAPWSAEQREWLQALGHPAMALAGSAPAAMPDEPVRAAPAPASAVGAPSNIDALFRALLRATGQRAAEAEQVLRPLAIELAALRGNPAGKRALWPRLRRFRRRAPT